LKENSTNSVIKKNNLFTVAVINFSSGSWRAGLLEESLNFYKASLKSSIGGEAFLGAAV
jgi:hypothetical protein